MPLLSCSLFDCKLRTSCLRGGVSAGDLLGWGMWRGEGGDAQERRGRARGGAPQHFNVMLDSFDRIGLWGILLELVLVVDQLIQNLRYAQHSALPMQSLIYAPSGYLEQLGSDALHTWLTFRVTAGAEIIAAIGQLLHEFLQRFAKKATAFAGELARHQPRNVKVCAQRATYTRWCTIITMVCKL